MKMLLPAKKTITTKNTKNTKKLLQELGQAINKLQQTAQNDVAKKTQEVYEPIIEKAKKAIAEVAKDKGYTYVIDASIGGLLYTQPNDNIIDEVKKKLKIK